MKVVQLVDNQKKAKDKESFTFLKNVLNIKVDSGTELEDTIFNEEELVKITITVSDINIEIKPVTLKNDFYIANGSYNIMFTNGSTNSSKYKIVTKLGTETDNTGIIGANIFAIEKTDFNATFQNEFKVGQSVDKFQISNDLISMLDQSKVNVKSIFGLEKFLNKGSAKLIVTKNERKTGTFISNDKITVRVNIGEVWLFVGKELTVNPR